MTETSQDECQHRTTTECCNGWDERCLDCGKQHV